MYRRDIVGIAAAAVLGLALLPGTALAQQQQQQKPMKSLLPGAWTLLLADAVKADGTHVPSFGPNPMGSLIFTPDGHYSLEIMRVGRPVFASKSRLTGTAEENKAAVAGELSHFGTYTVDEAGKTINIHIEASSYPNFDGAKQKRLVTAITEDVLTYTQTTPSAGGEDHVELVWKKAK
jgi:Lipocalin-like domain